MRRLRILLDVDGVIANFDALLAVAEYQVTGRMATNERATWEFGDHLTEEENSRLWEYLNKPGLVSNLDPYPGSVKAVKYLARHHDVYFVSSPMCGNPTWAHERTKWLERHFGMGKHLVATEQKHLVAGDVLVDDKVENVERWQGAWPFGVGLLFDRPYNKGSQLQRVQSLADVESVALSVDNPKRLNYYIGRVTPQG